MRAAGFPVRAEPPHLSLEDGKRPDGVTLINYSEGKPLIWDATIWTTLADSQLAATALRPGAAAEKAGNDKLRKYSSFAQDYTVMPLAFESHGSIAADTENFLKDLSNRINRERRCSRAGAYFQQRLCMAIQRGNANAITGSMTEPGPRGQEDE